MSYKLNVFTGSFDITGSGSTPTVSYIYFGDPSTEGSWRMRVSGNNLVQERLESGNWVEKVAATP